MGAQNPDLSLKPTEHERNEKRLASAAERPQLFDWPTDSASLAELTLVNDVLFRRLVCETGSCCSRRQYDLVFVTKSSTNRPQKILPVVFRHPEFVKWTRTHKHRRWFSIGHVVSPPS